MRTVEAKTSGAADNPRLAAAIEPVREEVGDLRVRPAQSGYSSFRLIDGFELTKRIGARAKSPFHGSGT